MELYMSNTIENDIKKLESNLDRAVCLPLSKSSMGGFPSKTKTDDEIKSKTSGSGRFIAEIFKGEKAGNYFAWHKPDIMNDKGEIFTKEEILNNFSDLLLVHLYSGEGVLLDRIGKMRGKPGSTDPSPLAFWRHDNDIPLSDVYVLALATGGTKKGRANMESRFHSYTKDHSEHGKRFALAGYSESNGEKGTKAYTIENEILGYANMKPEDAMGKYATLQEILNTSLGIHMAANSAYYLEKTKQTASIVQR